MPKTSYNDRPYGSFTENVAGALVGKEGYGVEFAPGTRNIQLYTATGARPPLGFIMERLEGGSDYSVRKIGAGFSTRMVASGNIAANAQVKLVNGGTIVQAATNDLAVGISVDGVAHVAGDVLEVADNLFTAY